MYIDAHTHLNTKDLFENWQDHISEFEKIWWEILINSWADDEYNKNWITIAHEYAQKKINNKGCIVKATIWFHPYEVVCKNITKENIEQKMTELKNQYLSHKEHIVAIGECGIDTHYPWWVESVLLQQELLKMHCELARELDLPMVIHSRDDFANTVEILKEYKDLKIYIHCRGYWPSEIKIAQEMFSKLWIWFCGNISYKKAQNIRDSLEVLDLDKLLLETDAPYLTPQIIRWETNYPANVRYIYDFVAEQLGINLEGLSEIIKINCEKLYFK